jgi:ligand-binding SRPBCC domain-containing protein
MVMKRFSACSTLSVPPEEFWNGVTLSSVNTELAPLVRMTVPKEWKHRRIEAWPAGRSLFRSVLLFGVLPVDVHRFRLEWVNPGHGFRECSSSWLNEVWLHERTTRPCQGGCVVVDALAVQSRFPFMHWLLLPIYQAVFRHRHRRLRAIFGVAETQ